MGVIGYIQGHQLQKISKCSPWYICVRIPVFHLLVAGEGICKFLFYQVALKGFP